MLNFKKVVEYIVNVPSESFTFVEFQTSNHRIRKYKKILLHEDATWTFRIDLKLTFTFQLYSIINFYFSYLVLYPYCICIWQRNISRIYKTNEKRKKNSKFKVVFFILCRTQTNKRYWILSLNTYSKWTWLV